MKAVCGGEVESVITYFKDEELVPLNDKVDIKNSRYWLGDKNKLL
jgi:hypothetical protein